MALLLSMMMMWSWVATDPEQGSYVDVIRFEAADAYKLAEKYPEDARIAANEPLLPEFYRRVKSWTVISEAGVSVRAVKGVSIRNGAGEQHLIYWLDGPPVEGLAVNRPWPRAGALEEVKPERLEAEASAQLMKQVLETLAANRKAAAAKAEAEGEEVEEPAPVARKRPRAKDIDVVKLETRTGVRTLAFVHIPQGDEPATYLAAVAVLAADGRVDQWYIPPSVDLNAQEPLYTVDLEGTGEKSLVYRDAYYEGSFLLLLRFDPKGKAKWTMLTGDGA